MAILNTLLFYRTGKDITGQVFRSHNLGKSPSFFFHWLLLPTPPILHSASQHFYSKVGMEEIAETEDFTWSRETVPRVLLLVSSRLSQGDLFSLLLVNPWIYRTLVSASSLWEVLNFRERKNAGNRLIAALSLPRYRNVKQINLEFAQDVDDTHLTILKTKCSDSLKGLDSLNLNGCQKISDEGVEAVTSCCPQLKTFSIYWNVRLTDAGLRHLVKNCKGIVHLNISGCKNISDQSLEFIADNYSELESLNLTRCVKLTDSGLKQLLQKCLSLQSLNLYALSSFTDKVYKKMSLLVHLKLLDLCGAQNLSDEGLSSISKCKNLITLNLTWCVRVTDEGVISVARSCTSIESLSLFGITGVTDKSLETLSKSGSNKITTLDVNGCIGIKNRSREKLLQLFPNLKCFKVHS
ncbi:F-box protein At3g58530 [Neltuma alba]|uniref:F-box protein At3g58530 n=1 Tax=Neltuma alba TaxID=207710 RepID=UPI0010A2D030|nr:F-box protein At3g58530 [Prosopis alba]